jgi:hypothetical protein
LAWALAWPAEPFEVAQPATRRARARTPRDRAEEKGDAKEFDVGVAKLDILEPQMGPDYLKMMDGLGDVDPNSAEGQKYTAVFEPLHKKCGEADTKSR